MFDILRFLTNHGTPYKNERHGWVQICCPFCNDSTYHLGITLDGSHGHCWRCRGKSMLSIIQRLLNCSWSEAGKILNEYSGESRPITKQKEEKSPWTPGRKHCPLPEGTGPMTAQQKRYLESRRFDAELLEKVYGLQGTGYLGEHAFRIVIPIIYRRKMVSWQTRDITGKAGLKYITCASSKEIIHHKHILYGMDLIKGDACAVVEGVTDQWRLGPGACATFGTGFKAEQAQLIAKNFRRAFLIFDAEEAAQQTADEMGWMLEHQGVETLLVELDSGTDPGDMKQDDANALMRELGLGGWER
jgi:DNA primase